MAVRVKVRIKSTGGNSLEASALVNTGFETRLPSFSFY
jgi:hypothetical protein